jgi:hypothetical protein
MDTQRKIQLGALAVLGNSLLALVLMASTPAHANPCSAINTGELCSQVTLAYCQAIAKPGCTATSVYCPLNRAICLYQ